MNHAANRESYRLVPETCPNIDKALHDAEEAIKEQTSMLRDALTVAIERYQDAEELVDELEIKVQSLENDLEYYKGLCERYDSDD
jgi:polyhydroxyalkanoate synthesis regulator phasin